MTEHIDGTYIFNLKQSVNLAEFVTSSKYDVRNVGGEDFIGCCPFHKESSPSFRVNKHRYHCFGCGAHGDIFTWLQKIEGLSFTQAVRRVGGDMSLVSNALVREKKEEIQSSTYDAGKALRVMEINGFAQDYFLDAARLILPYDKVALDFFRSKMTPEQSERFYLGYAPNGSEGFIKSMTAMFTNDELEAAGLIGRRTDGSLYARLRDRITIPLFSTSGHILGFAGRIINRPGNEELPKYVNPPTTSAFSKKRYLYGLSWGSSEDVIFLVEGYFDTMALIMCGRNAFCIMGTSLTKEQANQIEALGKTTIILMDGDEAGYKATIEIAMELNGRGVKSLAVFLPPGKDPDELSIYELQTLPKVSSQRLFLDQLNMSLKKEDYDLTLLQNTFRPYCEKNVADGYPHYNLVDFICQAYPEYAPQIRQATQTMLTDTIVTPEGKKAFKIEHIKALLKAWKAPCLAVRKRNGN